MPLTVFLSLSLFLSLPSNSAAASPGEEADARAYANLERIIGQADTIREEHEPNLDRLNELRLLYLKGENAPALIKERNELIPRLESAFEEIGQLRDEFKDASKGLQMRMVMGGLGAAMSKEGLQISAFSRYISAKERMDRNSKFRRAGNHLLLEEKPDFIQFEFAYKKRRTVVRVGSGLGFLVLLGTGAWWRKRTRRASTA